jgi:dihydropyrimidinase
VLDLVIKGGTVVTPSGVGQWDIAVQGEKIAAVVLPGALPNDARKTIDGTGKIVVPGGVEAHTHVGFPHITSVWGNVTAGPEELSMAALWGGTTTMLDFAKVAHAPSGDAVAAVNEHMDHFKGRMYIDYSAHCSYYGPSTTPDNIAQVRDLVAAGFPSIKVYTTNHAPRPGRPITMINTGQLVAIMEQSAKHGAIVAIHSEDDDIVQWNYEMALLKEEIEWWRLPQIRSNISEDLSVRKCIRIAELTGSAMYIVHTSAKEGVDAIAESRSRGYPVDGETILLYCSFNSENYKEHDGMKYHTYPSTKSEVDRLRLWDGLHKGDLNILATDAIGTSYKDKIAGRTALDVQGGNNGIEIRMGVGYTQAVVKQGMSLERFVDITSTNPAKLLGFYPRKGAIAPGSDADIAIIDPSIKGTVATKDLHLGDFTPWEGWDIQGWPTVVTLRGRVMVEDGAFHGQPGDGALIPRKIDSSVFSGPLR